MLTWQSSNATSCNASGAWADAKPTSGTASTGALQGTATYTLSCVGASGEVSASTVVQVDDPAPSTSLFPLRTQASKRYLVDASGKPFLIQGDSAWSLIAQLKREEVLQYLDDRRSRGFNTVLVNLIEHKFATNAPRNAYDDAPFLTPGDFSTPNESYFAHADYVIAQAEQRGMLVLLTPAYMGFNAGDEGWYTEMAANGAAKLRTYAHFVANRFRQRHNILWINGGDYDPPDRTLLRAIAEGIREVDPQSLISFHGKRNTEALQFLGSGETWLQVNDIYTSDDNVVPSAHAAYRRSMMPFFLIEARYEGETVDALGARRQAYSAVLSGACGQLFGNSPVWRFSSGWQQALASAGAKSMMQVRGLLESTRWNELQPDATGTLLTGGVGTGLSQAVAALASDRSLAVIYVPEQRSISVDLKQLSGPSVRMRTFDVISGQYTTVAGSPVAASSGSRAISAPVGTQSQDWVLVLDSQ